MTALLIAPILFASPTGTGGSARADGSAPNSASEIRISPPTATPAQCALWKRVDPPRYRKYCI